MEKTLSFILALLMLLSIAPINAFAAKDDGPSRGDSELSLYDGKAKKYYTFYDDLSYHKCKVKGISYSLDTNTLTLSSYQNDKLRIDATQMGKKFKIKVNGTCEIERLNVLYGNVTITGTGTLTINKKKNNKYAIMGDSISDFTVDKNVTLKLFAKKYVLYLSYCNKDIFNFKGGNTPKISSQPEYMKEIYGYVDTNGSTGFKTKYNDASEGSTTVYGAVKYTLDSDPEPKYDVYAYMYSATLDRYFKDCYSNESEADGTYDDLKLQGYEIQKDGSGNYIKNEFTQTAYVSRPLAVDSKGKEYTYDYFDENVYEVIEIPELYNYYHIWDDEGAHEFLPSGITDVYYFKKTTDVSLSDLTKQYNTDIDSYSHKIKKTELTIIGKPKAAKLSKASALRGGFKATWKKVSPISGYQLQYATNSKFTKGKKTISVSKSSTSKTVSKLKRRKTYYVRIRTYKTVSGKKYYSSWSSYKKVKTK